MWRLVCFFLLVCGTLHAQLKEFMVSEMPRPEVAVVQANAQYPDDALVLIYSDIDGLEFRSSLGALDKQVYNATASRYELLLKPVKQMLFVAKGGFIEAKIATLNPNSKEVYNYNIFEYIATAEISPPGSLIIGSYPQGADVYIYDIKTVYKTPYTALNLNQGPTKIKLKKNKFEDFDTVINIHSNSSLEIYAILKPKTVWLNINSEPIGAKAFLEDTLLGTTPLSIELDLTKMNNRGNRLLKIFEQDYIEQNIPINLTPSLKPIQVNVKLLNRTGKYTILTDPPGALVFIDDQYHGLSPLIGELPAKEYNVKVQLEDYETSRYLNLELNKNENQVLEFVLSPIFNYKELYKSTDFKSGIVNIGNQNWFNYNLNTDHFRNGAAISQAKTALEWESAGQLKAPAWCYYNFDPENGPVFGKIYNWYAVADSRNLCPLGSHVATKQDWEELISTAGGSSKTGWKLKSKIGWSNEPPDEAYEDDLFKVERGNGIDTFGFNARAGGVMAEILGCEATTSIGEITGWWTSTSENLTNAFNYSIWFSSADIYEWTSEKHEGYYVRCIKDRIHNNKTDKEFGNDVGNKINFNPTSQVNSIEDLEYSSEHIYNEDELFNVEVFQDNDNISESSDEQTEIFTVVEHMPEFQGGEEKLREFLAKNIKYPSIAREEEIIGVVYVTFVVEVDGKINEVKSIRGLGGGLTEEAIRVVRMMPNWNAGRQNGKPVRVQFTLPIKFTLR